MNIRQILVGLKDSVVSISVGDEVTVDTNWRGVTPNLKKGRVIGFDYSIGSHENPVERLVKVKFENGSKGVYNVNAIQDKPDI